MADSELAAPQARSNAPSCDPVDAANENALADNPQAAMMALATKLHEEALREKRPARRLAKCARAGAKPPRCSVAT